MGLRRKVKTHEKEKPSSDLDKKKGKDLRKGSKKKKKQQGVRTLTEVKGSKGGVGG